MNNLEIDTSSNREAIVRLQLGQQIYTKTKKYDKKRGQIVLPLIKQLLDKNNLTFRDIDAVHVNSGPGSYTGLRVGVSIANALGFFLDISINKLPKGQLVEPFYT